jgi:hypothetical protein
MSFEVVQVNVLALVSLVGIALYGLNATVLALDLVLVGALLAETVPPLVVIVSSSALLGPGRLCSLACGNSQGKRSRTSLPFIIRSITSPEAYCSWVKPWAATKGSKAVARVAHFIVANKTAV